MCVCGVIISLLQSYSGKYVNSADDVYTEFNMGSSLYGGTSKIHLLT